MNLNEKQQEELWGGEGPYSEVKLLTETRILDDSVSRAFVLVETNINPFTYRMIKKNREDFADDEEVQVLLDNASYQGIENGYLIYSFREQIVSKDTMKRAQEAVEDTKKTVIRMHKYVLKKINERD
jgi:hypothetical protein